MDTIKPKPRAAKSCRPAAISLAEVNVAEAVKVIAEAAKEAGKLIASSAEDAKRALANAAAEAVKVNNVQGSGDHDLLIELKTLMGVMQNSMASMISGNESKSQNHDIRISDVEKKVSNSFIITGIYTATTIGLIALLITHMLVK